MIGVILDPPKKATGGPLKLVRVYVGPNSQAILALGMTGRLGPMMLQSGRIPVISRDNYDDSTELGVK